MKRIVLFVVLSLSVSFLLGIGVCIENAQYNECLRCVSSSIDVQVENQVGVITTTQTFKNTLTTPFTLKYAFPMYEDASATQLRWQISGQWYQAIISATQPDTIPGQNNMHPDLQEYLGDTPLYFASDEYVIEPDSTFQVELEYVQLLPYSFGNVNFEYPNDYTLVQTTSMQQQLFNFHLNSLRTIEEIELLSHAPAMIQNLGNEALVSYEISNHIADTDYLLRYSLSSEEMGLFSMSTYLDSAQVPDDHGNGFFTFIAEPQPDTSIVINKAFSLIIDCSGSMNWENKIEQARQAASFIVESMNPGDFFNIVKFTATAECFRDSHVVVNSQNVTDALNYIANLTAGGGTNISAAFDLAIPQYANSSNDVANMVIFLTDGCPMQGITNTISLANHVHSMIQALNQPLYLFCFGIGSDVNYQLLTLMATQNNGMATFLESNEVSQIITEFYLSICNPVLLNTEIAVSPAGAVCEMYPEPLPNLYLGSQMVVSGRYSVPGDVSLEFSGDAFNVPVSYSYDMTLCDSTNSTMQFLTKLWAKAKIEHLMIEYLSLNPNSPEALALKDEIIQISLDYGVISPFTNFSGPGVPVFEEEINDPSIVTPAPYTLLGNYPNPFNPSTRISFSIASAFDGIVYVKVFNAKGQMVRLLAVHVHGPGSYSVEWDGTDLEGNQAASGVYFYSVDFGDAVLVNKMLMLK
jgi:Ca-activated chloride channel family protein